MVERSLANGVLVFDDTGLPKQGKSSVGVQHQYSGTLGKQANGQLVISAEDVVDHPSTSQPLHWPLSVRLYLPEIWAEDPERRQSVHVPETVASDFGVCLPSEMEQAAVPQAEPAKRKRGQPKKPRPAPRHDVKEVTEALPEDAWQTVAWREGSRGTLRKQFVELHVHAGTGCARHRESHGCSWPGPEGWLLGERPLPGEEGEPKWFFNCLPAQTPLPRLVELAQLRWPVEQFYEDGKGKGGLAHFQGRSWEGLQRHLALVMVALPFSCSTRWGNRVRPTPLQGRLSSCAAIESSRMWSYGSWKPNKSNFFVLGETNRVVLAMQWHFPKLSRLMSIHAISHAA